ncbi:MAG: pyruvate kinase alpha/beta domain-containing protein, partial [Desulforhopalus sp.]
ANGKYPELAVRIMAKIANEIEGKQRGYFDVPYSNSNKLAAYLAKAAVKAALRLETKAIVADSLTGKSILALAAYRGDNVIYAQVYNRRVVRQLSLSYGVYADYIPMDLTVNQPLQQSICRLLAENHFNDSDLIVILAGNFGPKLGASYIEISSAENFRQKCGRM